MGRDMLGRDEQSERVSGGLTLDIQEYGINDALYRYFRRLGWQDFIVEKHAAFGALPSEIGMHLKEWCDRLSPGFALRAISDLTMYHHWVVT